MILAEATPDPQTLQGFLVTVGFLLWIGSNALALFRRGDRQKREVSFAEEFASKTEFLRLDRKVETLERKIDKTLEQLRCELKEDKDRILQAGEERAVKIHDRINVVLAGVSELKGRLDK